ncbi:MAG: Glu-tRNA(Gln) amidotransferase subunit GatE [Candidatus Micrarchaeota archaeon]|nr:Glu-tRNA(Gln) amidotransferase subunit GatE [Candidatus Micrarchaeota archaeon]
MKCGLEIHQRLASGKLFCRCKSDSSEEAAGQQVSFTRRLHVVKSELGEVDAASGAEAIRGRTFRYSSPARLVCLVEGDEEPPHAIDENALTAALAICHLLHARPVDRLHIMRKNVIDGSNTSGFQRTALLGLGGEVQTPSGKLAIQTICIEEESCAILEAKENSASYDLSRLGIPLVEIATAPDLKSGKEAQEAALAIGQLLRKTGVVQRGLGSIRQDLNVSIPGGARVEIKGVQDLSMIAKTIETEARRQQALLEIASEISARLEGRKIEPAIFDLTEIFQSTACQVLAKAIKNKNKVLALPLPSLAGLLGKEISPNRRFGTELSDYARSMGVSGIFHSDEDLAKYGFSEDELAELKVALSIGQKDAFVLAAGEAKKAQAALFKVADRINSPSLPGETRRANPDGTSTYLRPLPGKARMYPETDLPPVPITLKMLEEAARIAKKAQRMEEEQERLLSLLNDELAAQLSSVRGLVSHNSTFQLSATTSELSVFTEAIKLGVEPKFAASTLTNTLQSLKREGENIASLDEPRIILAFRACQGGAFSKAAMAEVLRQMCREPSLSPQEAAKKLGLEKLSGAALEEIIKKEGHDFKSLMAKYRMKIDAQEAQEIFKKIKK